MRCQTIFSFSDDGGKEAIKRIIQELFEVSPLNSKIQSPNAKLILTLVNTVVVIQTRDIISLFSSSLGLHQLRLNFLVYS